MIYVVGSGVVGKATGTGLISQGHSVAFIDIDPSRVQVLIGAGFEALFPSEMHLLADDTVLVAVPTPASANGIDLSSLNAACESIGVAMRTAAGAPLIVFRSTMPPGTTRGTLIPRLESASGRTAHRDFHVCYQPEYLRQNTAEEDVLNARLITVGTAEPNDLAFNRFMADVAGLGCEVYSTTYEAAEFQKYVHNAFNAAKVSFFNEMRSVGRALGIADVDAVFALTAKTAQGLQDPTYGIRDHGPYSGACLPKDVAAWLAFTDAHRLPSLLMEAVAAVNELAGAVVKCDSDHSGQNQRDCEEELTLASDRM